MSPIKSLLPIILVMPLVGATAPNEDLIVYPVIKGTTVPDRSSDDRLIIRDGAVYPVIPGTNVPSRTRGEPVRILPK